LDPGGCHLPPDIEALLGQREAKDIRVKKTNSLIEGESMPGRGREDRRRAQDTTV